VKHKNAGRVVTWVSVNQQIAQWEMEKRPALPNWKWPKSLKMCGGERQPHDQKKEGGGMALFGPHPAVLKGVEKLTATNKKGK